MRIWIIHKIFGQTLIHTFLLLVSFTTLGKAQINHDLSAAEANGATPPAQRQKWIISRSANKGDNVHCSLQDQTGNLWFGGGICRYDGTAFNCFGTKDGMTNSDTWSILEDHTGKFWIGARETGLYCFDGVTFIKLSE